MSPRMSTTAEKPRESPESQYLKGVKNLYDNGIKNVPRKYILPVSERPNAVNGKSSGREQNLKLPIIDLAELQGPNCSKAMQSLSRACENYGFFQIVNHGISPETISNMIDVAGRFFQLPLEEREKYMSADMTSTVRYGTSFNQTKDSIFCWRDFLKLLCHPLSDVLPHWPSSPSDFRNSGVAYAIETKFLFMKLVGAILESLGVSSDVENSTEEDEKTVKEFEDGSQLMIVNFYPPCPEPHLTLGMPPHSDYGFLTLLLQDEVEGLQIQHQGEWLTVEPIPGSFVINVGDHLEIFSNGRYKSVLHRVLVNSTKARISVASLHSLPFKSVVRPSQKLINETNPKRYMDTDFAAFLAYLKSCDSKEKNFLESRKLTYPEL